MKILQKSYNTLRVLSAEMIASSQIGDVRSCVMCAPVMFTLFKDYYNYFGGRSHVNRDRFVLADVSLAPLYYATLNLFGISFETEDLKNFGTEAAPATPSLDIEGIDAGISAKGQGIPTAVGLALMGQSLAAKFNAQKFNIISHYTYCFASTSNLQEGVSQEAMALAGSLKLSKLIILCNYIEEQAGGEKLKQKYGAMGWNVIVVSKSSNAMFLNLALTRARISPKPTLILLKNTLKKHFPQITERLISQNEVEKMKADFGFNGAYKIENAVRQYALRTTRRLRVEYNKWEKRVVIYRNTHPQLSEELNNFFVKPKFPITKALKTAMAEQLSLTLANKTIVSEIRAVQKCITVASIKEKLLPIMPEEASRVFSRKNYRALNIVFGNRENAMAEICTGISLYFGSPTYVYAPICLLGQMLSGIEHAAKSSLPVLFCFYQSGNCVNLQKTNLELYGQFEWLSNLKNLDIYQPATATELLAAYKSVFERARPAAILLAQQPNTLTSNAFEDAQKGVYVFQPAFKPDLTLVAGGREFYIAKEVAAAFEKSGRKVKLVSAPSWKIFDEQTTKYKDTVLPKDEKVIIFTRTSMSTIAKRTHQFQFINVNDFTDTPELITPDLVKSIKKQITENKSK